MSLTLTFDTIVPAPRADRADDHEQDRRSILQPAAIPPPATVVAAPPIVQTPEIPTPDVQTPDIHANRDRHGLDGDAPALSSYARCSDGNGTLSFLFFSEDDLELARAKAICRTCGMQEACLAGAIEREEPYGVWGGKIVLDGVPVEFKRKRGRPPKHPKPILVVDEAPVPPHLVA